MPYNYNLVVPQSEQKHKKNCEVFTKKLDFWIHIRNIKYVPIHVQAHFNFQKFGNLENITLIIKFVETSSILSDLTAWSKCRSCACRTLTRLSFTRCLKHNIILIKNKPYPKVTRCLLSTYLSVCLFVT